jgi:hypothetical protein
MSDKASQAGTWTVVLDEQERSELSQLLDHALRETRVEVHHTHTPDFRDQVQRREEVFRRLIEKLRQAGA